MKRENVLRARLRTLNTLSDAIAAMRSLSAHHLRLARAELAPTREYRNQIEDAVREIGLPGTRTSAGRPAFLILGPELGLCGNFNSRIAQYALHAIQENGPPVVYCVGRRTRRSLEKAGGNADRAYPAATSCAALPRLLLELAQDILGDYLSQRFSSLEVVSARFEGVGAFLPVQTRILPLQLEQPPAATCEAPYVTHTHSTAVAVRELLYSRLQQLLLDGLAAEHGMRLVAAETARQWLDSAIGDTKCQLITERREVATQEVLDIAAGARNLKKGGA